MTYINEIQDLKRAMKYCPYSACSFLPYHYNKRIKKDKNKIMQ